MSDMVVNEIHAVMVTVLGRAHRKKEEGRTFLSLRLMIKPVRFISIDICFVMALWNVCRLQQLIQQQNVGKLFKFILKKNSKNRYLSDFLRFKMFEKDTTFCGIRNDQKCKEKYS